MAIDQLINTYFSQFYNVRRQIYPIQCIIIEDESFSLTDNEILTQDSGVLNIKLNQKGPVQICLWEQYFNQFNNLAALKPKRCDLLIEQRNKHFILAELTKSKSEHILPNVQSNNIGKRAYAWVQLNHTLENLGNVPEIETYFSTLEYKYILFAFRLTQDNTNTILAKTFEKFFKPLTIVPVLETEDNSIPFDFKYLQIQFPEAYQF
jgi:hypothetical protein